MLFSIAEHYLSNIIVIVSWNTFILYLWISQSMTSLENNSMYGYQANLINDSKNTQMDMFKRMNLSSQNRS